MSPYKHKLVNGELVELTEDEIAAFEQRDVDADLPSVEPSPEPEPEEPTHAHRRSKRR